MCAESSEPVKVFCRGCRAKLDVSALEPFSKVACPECGTMLRVPQRFGRYLLEKLCGRGGMSLIYRAIEPQLARRVAVKILEPADGASPDEVERFLAGARLVSRLMHPGIIPVYDCGVWEGRAFMTMRFMENGSLEYHLKNGTLPELGTLLANLAAVAEGLAFAFSRGIVHHDVKPGNILLTREGEAKLGDFDLAGSGDVMRCGDFCSPAYASPERLYSGAEDFRGDVFSFGVTIYELAGGRTPFGIVGEPEDLLERRRSGKYPALSDLRPELCAEVSELVGRMLAFEPQERPEYPEIIRALRGAAEALQATGAEEASRSSSRLMDRIRHLMKK